MSSPRDATSRTRVCSAAPSPHRYDPAIDGVRGVAIILVLLFHTKGGFSGGFLGVDLFFGLSGYLITTLLLQEWQTHGRIRLGLFYARRALRLLPAVLALLALLWVVVLLARGLFATSPALMMRTTLYTLLYSANWVAALQLGNWPSPLAHLWSLAVEEQFYLVWPVLLIVMLRWKWSPTRILGFLVAVAMLVMGWRAQLWWQTQNYSRVYFATDTRVDGLLLGCAMAVALHYRLVSVRGVRRAGLLAVIAFAACSLVLVNTGASPYYGGLAIVSVAVATAIGALASSPTGPVRTALQVRPLVWLGRISYGLYLWHAPVFFGVERAGGRFSMAGWAMGAAQIAVAVGVAATSYYLLEQPALRLKRYFYPASTPEPVFTPAPDTATAELESA